jgi:quercetin dioxygenase-like cupin family protein
VRFDEAELPDWKPVRRHLGVGAFGTNAFVAANRGDVVIERHDELPKPGEQAHQELYLVLQGRARFTVDGSSFDVEPGGIVFIDDPQLVREAVAAEPQTVVFAVGAPPESGFTPSEWEERFFARGRPDAV